MKRDKMVHSRSIKCRAWNGNVMLDPVTLGKSDNESWKDYNYGAKYGLEIMQFTGLHDKNGTEIYEGDIVKVTALLGNDSFIVSVQWDDELARFMTINSPLSAYAKQSEVIGNIYQHPNLLK